MKKTKTAKALTAASWARNHGNKIAVSEFARRIGSDAKDALSLLASLQYRGQLSWTREGQALIF